MKHLVTCGALVYPKQVVEELGRFHEAEKDVTYQWAENSRKNACRHVIDLVSMQERVLILPNILDHEKPDARDEADPYVLQLALQLRDAGHAVSVVTEERTATPRKMPMNAACGLLRLVCMTARVFLHDRGIRNYVFDLDTNGAVNPYEALS